MAATARLFINGKDVGEVVVETLAEPWGLGKFKPHAGFSEFAALFGNWSLLMHADDDEKKLTPEAAEELRHVEQAIDSLRCKLLLDDTREWIDIRQLNIDAAMIEWKVSRRNAPPTT